MAQNTNTYNRIINQLNDLPSDCRWSHDGGDFWLDIKAAANAVMLVKVHIDEVVETEGPWWVEVRRLHGLGHLRQLMGSEATEEDADRMWHLLLNADKLVFDGHGNEWLIEDDDDRNWEAMVSEVIASQS